MLPIELKRLRLISARKAWRQPSVVPDQSGVYLFFLKGGLQILDTTRYFQMDDRVPASTDGFVHMYSGAASNLRDRIEQHMRRDMRSSSLRKSLLAVERRRKAISKSGTASRKVEDEEALTGWLNDNAIIGIEIAAHPFERERAVIETFISPFNITLRRRHPYSKALMAWRREAFPPWRAPCDP